MGRQRHTAEQIIGKPREQGPTAIEKVTDDYLIFRVSTKLSDLVAV